MKRNIKKRIRTKLPGVFLLLRTLDRVIHRDTVYIQRVLSMFDDPQNEYLDIKKNGSKDYGKIIYVIRENSNHEGFCATIRFVIGFLIYAQEHGFEPVIKLTENYLYYDEQKSKEISNPWEYYFQVPDKRYDENAALHVCYSKYYHMMTIKEYQGLNAYSKENYFDENLFQACSPIINKYLVLKPDIVSEAAGILKRAKDNGKRILGVHFRGTDFKQGYNKHPVFVDTEQMLGAIKRATDSGHFDAVFLATDDASFCDRIRENFEDIELLQHTDVFRSNGDTSVAFIESDRECHHYLLGYEIARDMYTLSLCDGLVAGKSSVSYISNLYKHSRNENYEYIDIIDNGNNLNDKNSKSE
ncbi:hypothetical protein B0O40_1611 [Ruminococcaceae bacterium R-25]|nr:hypothetical protein B0O40_1611 [Ruminococcaceae bacterium R-25]SUQ21475.1 hypothetical protein SAMN06297423_1611 [Oscillospiraceae bacterium]